MAANVKILNGSSTYFQCYRIQSITFCLYLCLRLRSWNFIYYDVMICYSMARDHNMIKTRKELMQGYSDLSDTSLLVWHSVTMPQNQDHSRHQDTDGCATMYCDWAALLQKAQRRALYHRIIVPNQIDSK